MSFPAIPRRRYIKILHTFQCKVKKETNLQIVRLQFNNTLVNIHHAKRHNTCERAHGTMGLHISCYCLNFDSNSRNFVQFICHLLDVFRHTGKFDSLSLKFCKEIIFFHRFGIQSTSLYLI